MNKIELVKHPLQWRDSLGGVALKDKEKLTVNWPDGSLETISVHLVSRRYSGSLHLNHEAYFTLKYKGRDAWVRLLGVPAVRL